MKRLVRGVGQGDVSREWQSSGSRTKVKLLFEGAQFDDVARAGQMQNDGMEQLCGLFSCW